MTKEEYKNCLCKHCINYNCKENICELNKDTYKIYKCINYVSIFICNQNNCRKCGKCL